MAAEHDAVRALVNCHFAIEWSSLRDSTVDGWEAVVRTNVLGPVVATKAFLPLLDAAGADGGAAVVHLGSIDGFQGNPWVPSYSASKGAIPPLTHVMADELAPAGIRVNCVARAAVFDPVLTVRDRRAGTGDGLHAVAATGPARGDRRGRAVPGRPPLVLRHRHHGGRRRRPQRPHARGPPSRRRRPVDGDDGRHLGARGAGRARCRRPPSRRPSPSPSSPCCRPSRSRCCRR